ncbi:hypothetical protein [Thermococcus sp.]|uniref:hypothetical protein n=1 Tax=Thermococcus sp. TaxID=35749 RepID=UPI0026288155|nr:hypothetical protein [Thermococcus sp.]
MGDEPPSRSLEMRFLKATLNSRNEEEFSRNVEEVLRDFGNELEQLYDVKTRIPTIVPVDDWTKVRKGKRVWLPLSEIEPGKGIQYVSGPAVNDVVRNPSTGPFYVLTWELLLGTVLVSLKKKLPADPLGALVAGAVVSVVMNFDGEANAIAGINYLDKLYSSASALLADARRILETNPFGDSQSLFDFYTRAAYQLTFDAVSLWTASIIRTVTWGLMEEHAVGRNVMEFLLRDPEANIGIFHAKGNSLALLTNDPIGKGLSDMAFEVTRLVLTASSFPRIDSDDFTSIFR